MAEIKTAAELIPEVENIIKKYFPNSTSSVRFSRNMLPGINVQFALGKKSDWASGYDDNSPLSFRTMFIYGFNNEGEILGNLEFRPNSISMMIKPPKDSYLAYGRAKISTRKKKGDVKTILKGVESAFSNMHKVAKANISNLANGHEYVKKYL